MPNTIRLPFIYPIEFRNDSTEKGSKMVNCYMEKDGETVYAVKRPGVVATGIQPSTGTSQGLYVFKGNLISVINNTVYSTNSSNVTTTVGTLTGTVTPCFFAKTANDSYLFFQKGDYGYTYDGTTLTQLSSGTLYSVIISAGGSGYVQVYPWTASIQVIVNQVVSYGVNSYVYTTAGTTGTSPLTFTSGSASDGTATAAYLNVWAASTTYSTGDYVASNGNVYLVSSGGTSGTTLPSFVLGTGTDGTASLTYVTSYLPPVVFGTVWTASTAVTLNQQIFYGANLYTVTVAGTLGTSAPTFTSGSASNGTATLTYAGNAAKGYATVTSTVISDITLSNLGSGYTVAPTVIIGTQWKPTTTYPNNFQVTYNGNLYTVLIPGTSGTTGPTSTDTTTTFTNGGTTMLYVGPACGATSQLNGFPSGSIVPGASYFDTYVFIMTSDGKIWNSESQDPTRWNALNFITAESEPDLGVGIVKHLNYLVAFKQWSTQFFYDAAVTVGSPLLPNLTFNLEFGCASGNSIVQMEETVVWIAEGKDTGKTVLMLNGTRPMEVSNNGVERILNNTTNLENVRAYSLKISGHYFYILNLLDDNITLVLDIKLKQWMIWTSYVNGQENILDGVFYASWNNKHYTIDNVDGNVYNINENSYTDDAGPIQFRVRSNLFDAETTKRKFISRLEIVGDKIGTTLNIRHTDDDYNTWSEYRKVDLKTDRSVLYQNGSFRRRAYEFFNTDNVPLRLQACEIDAESGSV